MKNTPEIYFNQLNGIRFVAVFLVLMDHWLVPVMPFPTGHLGVVIFFVLSGFLITRILFESADDVRANQASPWQKIIRFVFRRSLRIFPIYYIVLGIGFLWNISNFNDIWIWLISYTPNLYMMWKGTWLGVWDHVWSLAVEEQYYLIFPYFILFGKKANYKWLFASMLGIGICSRFFFFAFNDHVFIEKNYMVSNVNPLSALDCFGLGGILGYVYHYQREKFTQLTKTYTWVFISALFLVLVLYFSAHSTFVYDNIWYAVIERFSSALFAFFLIAIAVAEKKSIWASFLSHRSISYLGKISYGLYLYHNFIYNYYHTKGNTLWGYLNEHIPMLHLDFFNFTYTVFTINLIILILVASFSWFFIEKPINAFKNKY